ncbi:L,D-transpeptidase family protein [Tissierella pigra]|uniref:Murein L,D-transpeptidase n=1 Tax=Tissierella pigra TaxID=2607614 RepID=A0A6N7XSU1_9FIRM|nr:L,D-transpeptidase family protein [Tissierella pigra]MSU00483.1 murein L,D-transpeptidase [Tissierella pigra]
MWQNGLILVLSIISSTMIAEPNQEILNKVNINTEENIIEVQEEVEETEEVEDVEETEEVEEPEEIEEQKEIIKFVPDKLKIREGIASEDVIRIKRFLKEKGYMDMASDYFYDGNTKSAMVKYQRDNGLSPDGIIGNHTYEKINQDMENNNISISEIEIEFTKDTPNGKFIIINKDSNTLYHLNGKEIIKKYPVATGKEPEYTPEGKFSIIVKYVNPAWGGAGRSKPIKGGAPNNPLGKRWMGLNIKGGGVYGIHGNSNEHSIGKYISLGCIRMFNEDVEYLYNIVEKNTPVWIGSEEKLKSFGVVFK